MNDLNPELERLIAEEKATLVPSETSLESGLVHLLSDVQRGVIPYLDVPMPDLAAAAAGKATGLFSAGKLVVAMTTVGVGAGVGGVMLYGGDARDAHPQRVATSAPEAEEPPQAAENPPLSGGPLIDEPAPKPAAPAREALQGATFSKELALIQQAKSAVGRGDFALARNLLARHRAEFPRGQLGEDRAALFALVECQSGQVDKGKAAARAFIERRPNSIYVDRLRRVCLAR